MNSDRIACADGEARIEDRKTSARVTSTCQHDPSTHIDGFQLLGTGIRARRLPTRRLARSFARREYHSSGARSSIFSNQFGLRGCYLPIKPFRRRFHLGRFIEREGPGQYSVVEENPP